ncbi:hypothetical protein DFH28DRAFT_924723 [Melampsora americana]|nr:hypothetical protein DFH28DRAFT_924723 [Melampsora americana]
MFWSDLSTSLTDLSQSISKPLNVEPTIGLKLHVQLASRSKLFSSDEKLAWEDLLMIPHLQPASPTFLISLLVGADQLGITHLAQDTVKLIRKTSTPFTITRYLTFADGQSIDDQVSQLEQDDGCCTLEPISQGQSEYNSFYQSGFSF